MIGGTVVWKRKCFGYNLFVLWLFQALILSASESRTVEENQTESGKMITKVSTVDVKDKNASFNKDKPFKIVLVQMAFRHGDRSPMHFYPAWDTHTYFWSQGAGQLTKLGMQQAYKYGQELRQRYATTGTFLSQNYNQSEVQVRSTDVDRTLMTAQCLLAGLFPVNMTDWFPAIWQPIPVHTEQKENDHLFGNSDCPRLSQLNQQFSNTSPLVSQIHSKYKLLCDQLSKFTRSTINFEEASHISDTMFCEAQHNLSRPDWMTDGMFEQLLTLRNETNQLNCKPPEAARLCGGPLLAEMIKNMETRAANASSPAKLKLFSGHDTTIVYLGRALGIFNDLQPPYLATITLELLEQEGKFFVRTLYNNQTVLTGSNPFPLNISGCAQECPLPMFHSLLKDNILAAENRTAECAVTSVSGFWKQNGIPIGVGVVMVLIVGVTLLVYKVMRAKYRSQRGADNVQYHNLLQSEEDDEEEDDHMNEL